MCVIVQVNAGVELKEEVFKRCYDKNPQGWGIMYPLGGSIDIIKSLGSFAEFMDTWVSIPDNVNRVAHFRIATHGEVNLDNCHPFLIRKAEVVQHKNDCIAMMHNGIIQTDLIDADRSDSYNFAQHVVKPILDLAPAYYDTPNFMRLIEALTKNSKLLFMDASGEIKRTNPKEWAEKYDCFFSNAYSLYEPYVQKYSWPAECKSQFVIPFDDKKKSTTECPKSSGKNSSENLESAEGHYSDLLPYGELEFEEDEILAKLTAQQAYDMPYEDLLDWVQDYPSQAVDMLYTLLHIINGNMGMEALADG